MAIVGDELNITGPTTNYASSIEDCTRDCAENALCTFWEYDGTSSRCTLKVGSAATTSATAGTTYGAKVCLAVGMRENN